jgi:pSer/pThr/pTyr-binding forkhead associated (FHA) protein
MSSSRRPPVRSRPEEPDDPPDAGDEAEPTDPSLPGFVQDGGSLPSKLSSVVRSKAQGEDRDIYGEGDYPPEEEAYQERSERKRRRRSGETRIAPPADPEEDDNTDQDDLENPQDATNAGPPVRLEIVSGPDQGRVRRFKGVRMVIGRTSGCDLKLKDHSVSRRHLELILGDNGVLLRDLGSGNGTKVNGESVTERILQHEDQIAIGKTKFRFVDEAYALKRAEELAKPTMPEPLVPAVPESTSQENPAPISEVAPVPPPPTNWKERLGWNELTDVQKRMVLIGLGGAVLLIAVLLLVLGRRAPAPADPREIRYSQKVEEVRRSLDKNDADTAVVLLEQLERIRPKDPRAEPLKTEVVVVRQVQAARVLLDQGKLDEAQAELDKVPSGTARDPLKADLISRLSQRRSNAGMEKASAAIARGELEEAQRLVAALPEESRAKLEPQLNEAIERDRKAKRDAERKSVQDREERSRAEKEEKENELRTLFSGVARRFHAGEYDRAVLECDRVVEDHTEDRAVQAKASELKKLIPSFAIVFEDGQRKYKANALQAAVGPLRRARDLYQSIGFTGALGTRIDDDLAAADIAAGQNELAEGNFSDAAAYFREAQKLGTRDPRATEGLARISARADLLLQEGIRLRETNPKEATSKLKQVLELVPSGSGTYKKAKEALAQIRW